MTCMQSDLDKERETNKKLLLQLEHYKHEGERLANLLNMSRAENKNLQKQLNHAVTEMEVYDKFHKETKQYVAHMKVIIQENLVGDHDDTKAQPRSLKGGSSQVN